MLSDKVNDSELFTNPSTTLDGALSQYDMAIRSVILKHAPFKSHILVLRPSILWSVKPIVSSDNVKENGQEPA